MNEQSGHARKVLAFLDGGADCHLIRRDLYDELGLKEDPVKTKIGLADGTTAVEETYVTNLLVRGLGDAAAAGTFELTSVIVKEELADVRCRLEDRSALRFLVWEDGDPNKEIKVYKSMVHCFGLTCSPCVANYALNRCAVDNQLRFSDEAIQNVKFNFYVDDWLTGAIDVPHTVALIKKVDQLLGCVVFWLMKFSSDEHEALEGIYKERLSPHVADIQSQGRIF